MALDLSKGDEASLIRACNIFFSSFDDAHKLDFFNFTMKIVCLTKLYLYGVIPTVEEKTFILAIKTERYHYAGNETD